jgi:hypothetical protein
LFLNPLTMPQRTLTVRPKSARVATAHVHRSASIFAWLIVALAAAGHLLVPAAAATHVAVDHAVEVCGVGHDHDHETPDEHEHEGEQECSLCTHLLQATSADRAAPPTVVSTVLVEARQLADTSALMIRQTRPAASMPRGPPALA